jgi:hypothetical protein
MYRRRFIASCPWSSFWRSWFWTSWTWHAVNRAHRLPARQLHRQAGGPGTGRCPVPSLCLCQSLRTERVQRRSPTAEESLLDMRPELLIALGKRVTHWCFFLRPDEGIDPYRTHNQQNIQSSEHASPVLSCDRCSGSYGKVRSGARRHNIQLPRTCLRTKRCGALVSATSRWERRR